MKNNYKLKLIFISLAAMGIGACSDSSDPQTTVDAAPATLASSDKKAAGLSSPGKPGAPISFRYQVQGTPIVGQPVAVNVFVSSTIHDGVISVHYRVNDASSMMFPESQALRTQFSAAPGDEPPPPQRIASTMMRMMPPQKRNIIIEPKTIWPQPQPQPGCQ